MTSHSDISQLTPWQGETSVQLRERLLAYCQGSDLSAVQTAEFLAKVLAGVQPTLGEGACAIPDMVQVMTKACQLLPEMDMHSAALGQEVPGEYQEALRQTLTPAVNRGSMLPCSIESIHALRSFRAMLQNLFRHKDIVEKPFHAKHNLWRGSAVRRRLGLLALIILPSLLATHVMYLYMPVTSQSFLSITMLALFALLFAWISVGFWTALAGLWVVARGYDAFAPSNALAHAPLNQETRTAILFPVYNEDIARVTAGIRTTYQALAQEGLLDSFHIYILSDSTKANAWVLEEEAWLALCREEEAFGRIFYRRRPTNIKRKSGNVADFCRRWGKNYSYALVFDADSIMSAQAMSNMVRIMDAHPEMGILQSPPKAVNRQTLIARVQQFANHLYGPIFAAGLHYWQLGDAQYWGHNAIIRIKPFMEHCQLPRLPGKAPLGGEILSHDFVEAALMRRAGYSVWLAYDLDGSYEESPPSLVDELTRDRRWCQGNLQHSRLVVAQGFFPTHRALFINGIMSYGSAFLWLLFLLCSSLQALSEVLMVPQYFPAGKSLFPVWPTWYPQWAMTVLASTATLLFLPKIFSFFLVLVKRQSRLFGGVFFLFLSMLGEVVLSTLLAPVRMLFHSTFVLSTLLGRTIQWNAQNRDDIGTSWGTAFQVHWWGALLGAVWGLLMWLVNPGFFWWLSPIICGLVLSAPISVWISRPSVGRAAQKMHLFLTPPEVEAPMELASLKQFLLAGKKVTLNSLEALSQGFVRAVLLPTTCALHCTLNRHSRRRHEDKLLQRALTLGPEGLSNGEQLAILSNPPLLKKLHREVWTRPEPGPWPL